jgi:hypothetical protein
MDKKQFYSTSRQRPTTRRLRTLIEALDDIQEHQYDASVVVLPPEAGDNGADSDIEQTDENQLNEEYLHEPAGEVELFINESGDASDDDTSDDEPLSKKSKNKEKEKPKWKKNEKFDHSIVDKDLESLSERYPLLGKREPIDIWNLLMDQSILELIVQQSKLYAHRDKNFPEFDLSMSDLRRFIGILILSGYHIVPEESHYWSTDTDLGVSVVSQSMSLKRFLQIKKFIHLADNTALQQGNKVAKVTPVYDKINENLLQFGVFHKNLSFDESMVPYTLGGLELKCTSKENLFDMGIRFGVYVLLTDFLITFRYTQAKLKVPAQISLFLLDHV